MLTYSTDGGFNWNLDMSEPRLDGIVLQSRYVFTRFGYHAIVKHVCIGEIDRDKVLTGLGQLDKRGCRNDKRRCGMEGNVTVVFGKDIIQFISDAIFCVGGAVIRTCCELYWFFARIVCRSR